MSEPNSRHLLAIVQTQTEIAASDLDLDAVMQLIAERAQELTRASAGLIEIADGDEMVYRVTTGEATPFLGVRLKMASSLSGLCITEGRVLRSDDTSSDPRVDAGACRQVNARSMLCVPLAHQGGTVGVLKVYSPEAGNFVDADVETLELLSGLIAAHMSHAKLFAAEVHGGRHDALTGLLNRRAYEERLPVEIARASRFGWPLSLCLLDLDGFKKLNDTLGHPCRGQGPAAGRRADRRVEARRRRLPHRRRRVRDPDAGNRTRGRRARGGATVRVDQGDRHVGRLARGLLRRRRRSGRSSSPARDGGRTAASRKGPAAPTLALSPPAVPGPRAGGDAVRPHRRCRRTSLPWRRARNKPYT